MCPRWRNVLLSLVCCWAVLFLVDQGQNLAQFASTFGNSDEEEGWWVSWANEILESEEESGVEKMMLDEEKPEIHGGHDSSEASDSNADLVGDTDAPTVTTTIPSMIPNETQTISVVAEQATEKDQLNLSTVVEEGTIQPSTVAQQAVNDTQVESVEHRDFFLYAQRRWGGRLGNVIWQYASLLGIYYMNLERYNSSTTHVQIVSTGFDTFSTDRKYKDFLAGPIPPDAPWHTGFREPMIGLHENGNYAKFTDFDMMQQEHKCKEHNHSFTNKTTCIVTVAGYLQSYRYFENATDEIRRHLRFHPKILKLVDTRWEAFRQTMNESETTTIVGIHHRGEHWTDYMVSPPLQYYEVATDHFRQNFSDVAFIVASDNKTRCANLFGHLPNIHILPADLDAELEFALLATKSEHFIMSTGTYGWWAGFLAGGKVAYYMEGLDMSKPQNKNAVCLSDYYPSEWISFGETDWNTTSMISNGITLNASVTS